MKRRVLFGNRIAEVTPAAGVRGVLCKSAVDETYFFRIYAKDHTFVDYELHHDALPVTIDEDALASFYRIGEENFLDHSPSVLGLEDAPSEDKCAAAQQSAPADAPDGGH